MVRRALTDIDNYEAFLRECHRTLGHLSKFLSEPDVNSAMKKLEEIEEIADRVATAVGQEKTLAEEQFKIVRVDLVSELRSASMSRL